MKKSPDAIGYLGSFFLLMFSISAQAQYFNTDDENQYQFGNCTSIMVGRLASVDGSVMTSHTCDGFYRSWLEVFPHNKYEKELSLC